LISNHWRDWDSLFCSVFHSLFKAVTLHTGGAGWYPPIHWRSGQLDPWTEWRFMIVEMEAFYDFLTCLLAVFQVSAFLFLCTDRTLYSSSFAWCIHIHRWTRDDGWMIKSRKAIKKKNGNYKIQPCFSLHSVWPYLMNRDLSTLHLCIHYMHMRISLSNPSTANIAKPSSQPKLSLVNPPVTTSSAPSAS